MREAADFRYLLEYEEVKSLITERAHQLYLQRGAEPGRDWDDWLRAENDILQLAPFIDCAVRAYGTSGISVDIDNLSRPRVGQHQEFV
jgi:Protein of unknown function (DUF2934)